MPLPTAGAAGFRLSALSLSIALAAGAAWAAEPAADDTGETTLKAVKVTDDAFKATTEGSGSYTARSSATSTPLALSLRETPQSVTVLTRERIEDQALQSLTDVVNNVVGVSAKEFDSSRYGFSARGFDITNLMIDGIPTTWESGWSAGETMTDTAIYDRVEIVRGATGLTSGAGNPSAAINLVRKHADSRVFTGSASVSVGSWDNYQGMVDLSAPLNADGSVRGRVVANVQDKDSYIDLLHERKQTFYGVFEADVTERTLVRVGASRQNNDPDGSTWGGLPAWFSDGTHTDWSRSKSNAADWTRWGSTATTYFVNLEQQLGGDWTLRLVGNRSVNDGELRLLWVSGNPDPVTGLGMGSSPSNYDTSREQTDFAAHLAGTFELFGRRHDAAFGALRSDQDFDSKVRYATSASPDPINIFQGVASYPEPGWGPSNDYENYDNVQSGGYAVGRFSLIDPLHLILGARVTNWTKDGEDWAGEAYRFSRNQEITPYAGLIYDIDDYHSAYVSYSDIFNPQNYQDRNGRYLDPVTGEGYEAGLKGEYLEGRLNASLAVFSIKQDNLAQEDVGHNVPGTIFQAYYPANTTSEGYEIEIVGEPLEGWSVSAGWSQFHMDDIEGVPVNTSHPRRTLKLFTKYRLPGEFNKLSIGGGLNWEDSNYKLTSKPIGDGETVPARLRQGGYSLVSLLAKYEFTEQWSAQVNVNNLFDKKYYSQIGFYDQLSFGAPRNVLASLKYQF